MVIERKQVLPDKALDRLARDLFDEVQDPRPEKPLGEPTVCAGDEVGINLLEWLLNAAADDDGSEDWRPCTASTLGKGRECWAAMHS